MLEHEFFNSGNLMIKSSFSELVSVPLSFVDIRGRGNLFKWILEVKRLIRF